MLALGNDLLADDAVGLVAARELKGSAAPDVDIREAGGHGLDLLEEMEGYSHVLLLDSVCTGKHEPGTIIDFTAEDLVPSGPGSPHTSGLADALQMARALSLPLPFDLRILAVEIRHPESLGKGLSPGVRRAVAPLVQRAQAIVSEWASPSC